MFKKIKALWTIIKEHPRTTFLVSSVMGIIGEIIAIETNPDLIGFGALGGVLVGIALAAISIRCCCPLPENYSIDNAPLTAQNNSSKSSEPPPHAPGTSPTHAITIYYEAALVNIVDSKGKTLSIN